MAAGLPCVGRVRRCCASLRGVPISEYANLFGTWLRQIPKVRPPDKNSIFCQGRTFWLFLAQMFSSDGACQEAVAQAAAWVYSQGGMQISTSNSGYCQARARLPLDWLNGVLTELTASICDSPEALALRQAFGRPWKVFDGLVVSMPDTCENQKAWPQSSSQKPGCGFPAMRILVCFCLATGALLQCATGSQLQAEQTLWITMWDSIVRGDIILADRAFCSFASFYLLQQRGADCLMRLNAHRSTGVIKKRRLGKKDYLVEWTRSRVCPEWLGKDEWNAMPKTMLVRHITFTVSIRGFRSKVITLATTLLDPVEYPAAQLAHMYRRRWAIELFLRDLKTTMHMDVLRCKTPGLIQRELVMHWIAYNLLRGVMLQAAQTFLVDLERLSFKGALQLLREWLPTLAGRCGKTHDDLVYVLLHLIAFRRVPYRPNRIEPRARKRRPKNYQILTKPRHQFKEIKHRNKYRAAAQCTGVSR
jgi:hypothetical protein